jgi:hypothetical protein
MFNKDCENWINHSSGALGGKTGKTLVLPGFSKVERGGSFYFAKSTAPLYQVKNESFLYQIIQVASAGPGG